MSDLRCPKCGGSPAEPLPGPGLNTACVTCGDALYLDAAGLSRAARDPYVGLLVGGRFGLLSVIARGGMGVIYDAVQLPIGRRVAVKVLRRELFAASGEAELLLDRFRREARIVSRLSHPNIVVLHDFGEAADGNLFMAFEFLEGPTLHEALRDGPLPPERALRVAMQIAAGLEEAHRHGIVHRDLKPGNVMLVPDGEGGEIVKLVDFGIARLRTPDAEQAERELDQRLTYTGKLTGTPNYMSPEQIRGESVDARADVYSLGLMLHEMLTGRPAFTGRTPITIVMAQLSDPPPPLREAMGGRPVPPGLEDVVERAVRKDRAERYERASDLRRALEGVVRRGELLLLWSASGTDSDQLFAAIRRHAQPIVDHIVDDMRHTIAAYRSQGRAVVRRRIAFFFEWCTQVVPSEDSLVAFLAHVQRTGELADVRMAELTTAFSLVFPVLRAVIEGIEPEERALILRHWFTLERHFWLLLRIVTTHYEAVLAGPSVDTFVDATAPLLAAASGSVRDRDTMPQRFPAPTTADLTVEGAPEAGDFFENVLSSMSSGVLVVDQKSLTIRSANAALERLLDMAGKELVGRHVLDAFRSLRGVDLPALVTALQERGELPPTKLRLRTGSGRERWVKVSGGLYRDRLHRPRGVMLLVDDVTEREFLVDSFRRYVGPEIVEELLLTRRGVSFAGQRMEVTTLYVGLMGPDGPGSVPDLELDARPEETIKLLNRYFTAVVEAVTAERGLVDTFVKDTVMALFGAPFRHDDDALAAVRAALRIREAVVALNRELLAAGRPPLRMGAGIATGPATVGNVGSAERVNYTALGELVYRADRLRLRAAAGQLLVDAATEAAVRGLVRCDRVLMAEGEAWQLAPTPAGAPT